MFGIITPTYKTDKNIVLRCVQSVKSQTLYKKFNIKHIICSDGYYDKELDELSKKHDFEYMYSQQNLGHYGAGIRNFVLDKLNTYYVTFLDDDNIIYPNYLQRMYETIQENDYCTCDIIHCGPVQQFVGTPPFILKGNRLEKYWIDTLQLLIRTEKMKEIRWTENGYCSDGETYEKIGRQFTGTYVNETLGIHI